MGKQPTRLQREQRVAVLGGRGTERAAAEDVAGSAHVQPRLALVELLERPAREIDERRLERAARRLRLMQLRLQLQMQLRLRLLLLLKLLLKLRLWLRLRLRLRLLPRRCLDRRARPLLQPRRHRWVATSSGRRRRRGRDGLAADADVAERLPKRRAGAVARPEMRLGRLWRRRCARERASPARVERCR